MKRQITRQKSLCTLSDRCEITEIECEDFNLRVARRLADVIDRRLAFFNGATSDEDVRTARGKFARGD